jgi:hypothetical protein
MSAHPYLGHLLTETRTLVRRVVVVGDRELDAVALWNAHTYVYECGRATPYLHPHSPEPGSGQTTLLDALELTAWNAVQADSLSEAALFRMIDKRRPTLLFDEVDAVFGKKNSDSTEGIRQVLNSATGSTRRCGGACRRRTMSLRSTCTARRRPPACTSCPARWRTGRSQSR